MYVLKTASMKGYGIAHRRPFFGSTDPLLLKSSSTSPVTVHASFMPELSSERFQSWQICRNHGIWIPFLLAETTKSVDSTGRHSGPSLSSTVFLWSQETTIPQSRFFIQKFTPWIYPNSSTQQYRNRGRTKKKAVKVRVSCCQVFVAARKNKPG